MRIQGTSGLPQQEQHQRNYTVQQGDTLVSLASKFHTTPEALAKANNLPPDAALLPGQMMTISKLGTMQMVPGPVNTAEGITSMKDGFESDPLLKQYPKAGMMQMAPEQQMMQMVENPTTHIAKGIASLQDQFESVKSTLDPLIKQDQILPFMKK
jgi:LysM repeat protein